jgi:hypothetical protein
MSSTLYVDKVVEKTSAAGVHIPGHVIQVVQTTSTAQDTTASTSFVPSSLSASITPKLTSSKILVTVAGGAMDFVNVSQIYIHLYRSIAGGSYSDIRDLVRSQLGSGSWSLNHSYNYLDSPNTTSAVVYKPYYRTNNASNSMHFNNSFGVPITMTLMEIAQ